MTVDPPGSKGEVSAMESLGSSSAGYRVADRRRKPRIYEPFAARVRGVDGRRDPFEVEAVLDNLSAGGLYMWLKRHVEEGLQIFVLFRLATRLAPEVKGLRVAAHGRVLRSEPRPDGACGVAVVFERYHHL